jgi:hypothetical protein
MKATVMNNLHHTMNEDLPSSQGQRIEKRQNAQERRRMNGNKRKTKRLFSAASS